MKKYNFIIAIILAFTLGAIFSSNFKDARILSRVAATKKALHTTELALEAYYVDHHAYPGQVPLRNFSVRPKDETTSVPLSTLDPEFTVLEKAGGLHLAAIDPGLTYPGMAGLTTPVAYLPALPPDPFINFNEEKKIPFAYHVYPNPSDPGYFLWSPGPDKTYNITNPEALYDPAKKLISKKLRNLSYFPATMYNNENGDFWLIKKEHLAKATEWSD